MTAYAYLFLSGDRESLVSLADQQQAIALLAGDVGETPSELFVEEGCLIGQPFQDRPQGGRVLQQATAGDAILVARSSWVLASPVDGGRLLDELRERGVALYCADLGENISLPHERRLAVSEGCAPLVRKLLAALSECASADLEFYDREKRQRQLKRLQGKYAGGPVPFGWRVDEYGYLQLDREQQRVLKKIRSLREKNCSYREIAARIEGDYGIRLSHEGIRKILMRQRDDGRTNQALSGD